MARSGSVAAGRDPGSPKECGEGSTIAPGPQKTKARGRLGRPRRGQQLSGWNGVDQRPKPPPPPKPAPPLLRVGPLRPGPPRPPRSEPGAPGTSFGLFG